MTNQPRERVKSPCTSVCALNEADVCVGCFRTGQEISRWSRMNPDEQRTVVRLARERARADNPFA
ncbi:DUF1289 domain-containing protein [Simiduia sp. 21SJ11W-1]|uniref:DUF1289 domain-containing protein n=1 Tax=Simiduia sp. 21SJ11W-1 TaxID=2909669 RepID=UPI0020A203D0|nr:DUF1289 domain-containing protein [Simiduia sp. 21SJ11W-1]UTA46317.1 DUF1289 domain-containing protein [Simiduia sp. 21SJ11W-1]